MRLIRTSILVAICSLLGFAASAHDMPIERQAVLQLHPTHAELLLVYNEPPGPRTDRLLAVHDSNRNGEIDGVEGKLAKSAMLRRAFLGLEFGFGDAASRDREPEIRYKRDRSGGFAIAILRRTDVIPEDRTVDVSATMADGSGLPPLELVIEVDSGWIPAEGEPAKIRRTLTPGTSVTWSLKREQKPPVSGRRDWTPPSLPNVDTVR